MAKHLIERNDKNMSEVKAQKKVSTEPQKAKTDKAEAGTKGASETTKSADTTVEKTDSAPKSASQSSISHFSSVSTPAYKKGWENIFGRSKNTRTTASNTDHGGDFPNN